MAIYDTNVPQVIVNKLTAAQYATATKVPTEFYAVTDEEAVPVMVGATSLIAGEAGIVPAPAAGDDGKYLKGDGTWGTPTDTTYNNFTGTDGLVDGVAGLVPAPLTTDAGKFLKSDGAWTAIPAANNISSNDWSVLWQ